MKRIFFSSLFLLVAGIANAEEQECVSAGQRLHYVYIASEGGARIDPQYALTLDGKTLIQTSPQGGGEIRLADLQFLGMKRGVVKEPSSEYLTTYYTQEAKVTSRANNEILFQGDVRCVHKKYIGIPRP